MTPTWYALVRYATPETRDYWTTEQVRDGIPILIYATREQAEIALKGNPQPEYRVVPVSPCTKP